MYRIVACLEGYQFMPASVCSVGVGLLTLCRSPGVQDAEAQLTRQMPTYMASGNMVQKLPQSVSAITRQMGHLKF